MGRWLDSLWCGARGGLGEPYRDGRLVVGYAPGRRYPRDTGAKDNRPATMTVCAAHIIRARARTLNVVEHFCARPRARNRVRLTAAGCRGCECSPQCTTQRPRELVCDGYSTRVQRASSTAASCARGGAMPGAGAPNNAAPRHFPPSRSVPRRPDRPETWFTPAFVEGGGVLADRAGEESRWVNQCLP